jgi:hypothetical protein
LVTDDPAAGITLAERAASIGPAAASALARALRARPQPDLAVALQYESWLAGLA